MYRSHHLEIEVKIKCRLQSWARIRPCDTHDPSKIRPCKLHFFGGLGIQIARSPRPGGVGGSFGAGVYHKGAIGNDLRSFRRDRITLGLSPCIYTIFFPNLKQNLGYDSLSKKNRVTDSFEVFFCPVCGVFVADHWKCNSSQEHKKLKYKKKQQ